MSKTDIEWSDKVWNPTTGCSKFGPDCANCYAIRSARRMSGNPNDKIKARFSGITKKLPSGQIDWSGVVRLAPEKLADPLRWRKPQRIFVNSMSDLFHESLSNEDIAAVFGVMAAARQHTFQVLTKRSRRMKEWFEWFDGWRDKDRHLAPALAHHAACIVRPNYGLGADRDKASDDINKASNEVAGVNQWPLPNVWIGVSVGNQEVADKRIPDLLECPASVRFLSCEPLLGKIDLERFFAHIDVNGEPNGPRCNPDGSNKISWVIAGGESGPGSRPCDIAWIGSLVEQCNEAGVPIFVKQLGAYSGVFYEDGFFDRTKTKDKKGGDPSEWPDFMRVREFPCFPQNLLPLMD